MGEDEQGLGAISPCNGAFQNVYCEWLPQAATLVGDTDEINAVTLSQT